MPCGSLSRVIATTPSCSPARAGAHLRHPSCIAGPSPRCVSSLYPQIATRRACSSSRHALVCCAAASAADVHTQERQQLSPSSKGSVRRLILLRHADSETSSNVRDHDRPISSQGREEAVNIARKLADQGWLPDLIIASNSKRTKQTLDAMMEATSDLANVDVHYLGSLYTVAALDGQTRVHLEDCIRSMACDSSNQCIMCVGHNKGWEEAATNFAKQAVRLNTACAALFEAVGHTWGEATCAETDWKLIHVLTP